MASQEEKSSSVLSGWRDVFSAVLEAKGSISVGSQLDLTPPDDDDYGTLVEVVQGIRDRDLRGTISSHADDSSLGDFIKALFRVSPVHDSKSLTRRKIAFSEIFRLADDGHHISRDQLLNYLMTEAASLPQSVLPCLIEISISCITSPTDKIIITTDDTRWYSFEFLPVLLVRTFDAPRGELDPHSWCKEDLSSLDGKEYGRVIIDTVCKLDWPKNGAVMICSVLLELASFFSKSISLKVIDRALKHLKTLPTKEIPKLVQIIMLLLTSANGIKPQHQSSFMNKFIEIMESLENGLEPGENISEDDEATQTEDKKMLIQVEGAIISNFCITASKDVNLGRSFIKSCTQSCSGVNKLTVFRAGLLLGLARIKRLETQALDTFRSCILTASRRSYRRNSWAWLKSWNEPLKQAGAPLATPSFLTSQCEGLDLVLSNLVKHSALGGWDSVFQSLASLGGRLMESSTSAYPPSMKIARDVRIPDDGNEVYPEADRLLLQLETSDVICAALGEKLLGQSFRQQSIVQRDVLECIRVSMTASSSNSVGSIIRLVARLVDTEPQALLKEMRFLKDILGEVFRMPPRTVYGLLQALFPLFQLRPDLGDFLVLVFRKALFQRELQPRVVAVCGLVMILRGYGDPNSFDQAADLVACIQRCLGYQRQVRACLYIGLGEVIQSLKSPIVTPLVIELLLSHLDGVLTTPLNGHETLRELQDEDVEKTFPFKLSKSCVDRYNGEILDPIHLLLASLIQLLPGLDQNAVYAKQVDKTLKAVVSCLTNYSGDALNFGTTGKEMPDTLLAVFICEQMLTFDFRPEIWELQCKLMRCYARLRTKKTPKASNSSSDGAAVSATPAKKRKNGKSTSSTSSKSSASKKTKTTASVAEKTPRNIPSSLTIEQLVSVLSRVSDVDGATSFVMHSHHLLSEKLAPQSELRHVSGAEADALTLGTDDSSCAQIAALSGGRVPTCNLELATRAGSVYYKVLMNTANQKDLSLDVLTGVKRCILLVLETNQLETFIKKVFLFRSEDCTDQAIHFFLREICELALASGSKPSFSPATAAMGIVRLLVPYSRKPKLIREWIEENCLAVLTYMSSFRFMEACILAHQAALEMSDSDLTYLSNLSTVLSSHFPKQSNEKNRNDESDDSSSSSSDDGSSSSSSSSDSDKEKENKASSQNSGATDTDTERSKTLKRTRKKLTCRKAKLIKKANAKQVRVFRRISSKDENNRIMTLCLQSVVGQLITTLDQCDWVAEHLRSDTALGDNDTDIKPFRGTVEALKKAKQSRSAHEDCLYERLTAIASVTRKVLTIQAPNYKTTELLLRLTIHFYGILVAEVKSLIFRKVDGVSGTFRELVKQSKLLTMEVQNVTMVLMNEQKQTLNVLSKEAKLLPNLVFQTEQYEMNLLKLSKVAKKSNAILTESVCPTISRDYKPAPVKTTKKKKKKKKPSAGSQQTTTSSQQATSNMSSSATSSQTV